MIYFNNGISFGPKDDEKNDVPNEIYLSIDIFALATGLLPDKISTT